MSWRVLSVAYPLAPVGLDCVGGAEQVLAMLDRALVAAGHRSIVIAPEGSQVEGTLVPLPPVPISIDDTVRARVHDLTRESITRVVGEENIDLIHLHGIDFLDYLPEPGVPVLVTLHLPIAWYPESLLQLRRPRTFLHCVSESQQRTAPHGLALIGAISNGVDIEQFRPRGRKQNFAMLLGRICPEKGVDIALRACRRARVPLLIGGKVYPYPAHGKYFREEVTPLLDSCRRFLGPLALERKARLLSAARCLLVPSLAEETSSLVAMEALASGTPVIAFRAGALSEVVEDGRTGFLVDDEDRMQLAIGRAAEIDPAACRAAAVSRFDSTHTTRQYFDAYDRIIPAP